VPAGYELTTYDGTHETWTNGETIDGLLITGNLRVAHPNVTLTRPAHGDGPGHRFAAQTTGK